jgi:hypothetical protein
MVNGPGFLPGALFCYVRILLLYLFKLKIMNNKLTSEQIERLNELESVLKSFLYDIDVLREDGENEFIDVSSLFDDINDRIKELN